MKRNFRHNLIVSLLILTVLTSCFRNQSSSINVSVPVDNNDFQNPIEQVIFFEDQARLAYDQILYGSDYVQEQMSIIASSSTNSQPLQLVPKNDLIQFDKMIMEVAKIHPSILTNQSVWLAEATQLVHRDQVNNVTDELTGLFVIKMMFSKEQGDWVVAFIADLSTWELISWQINENPSSETSYTPVDIIYPSTVERVAYRRRVTESLNIQSLEHPLGLPIALLGNSPLETTTLHTSVLKYH